MNTTNDPRSDYMTEQNDPAQQKHLGAFVKTTDQFKPYHVELEGAEDGAVSCHVSHGDLDAELQELISGGILYADDDPDGPYINVPIIVTRNMETWAYAHGW